MLRFALVSHTNIRVIASRQTSTYSTQPDSASYAPKQLPRFNPFRRLRIELGCTYAQTESETSKKVVVVAAGQTRARSQPAFEGQLETSNERHQDSTL